MTHTRGAGAYRLAEAQSRTPLELVVMLYDGAIRFIGAARAAIERGDIHGRTEAISRALAIVAELQNTLDMDAGGSIAAELDELYRYVVARLMEASFRRDVTALDAALRPLQKLRGAWTALAAGGALPGETG